MACHDRESTPGTDSHGNRGRCCYRRRSPMVCVDRHLSDEEQVEMRSPLIVAKGLIEKSLELFEVYGSVSALQPDLGKEQAEAVLKELD